MLFFIVDFIIGVFTMGDFHQTESIATLHRLKKDNVDILESELLVYSKDRPIALVLPSLYS
ncbi:MAG: hypothetical protein V3T32_06425 [Thermodesulfobacteriota bacterium]